MQAATGGGLPLHWLCGGDGITDEKLVMLLEAAPEAIRAKDGEGLLPLHWAAFHKVTSAEQLRRLVEANPEACM